MRPTLISLFLSSILIALGACVAEGGRDDARDLSGAALAQRHCGNCHAFPEPARLTKAVWRQSVLPHMALRLGRQDSIRIKRDMRESLEMRSSGVFPSEAVVDSLTWRKILDYYVSQAPDSLPEPGQPSRNLVRQDRFRPKVVDLGFDDGPLTTLVHWDADRGVLYVGEGNNHLARYSGDGGLLAFHGLPSPPVAVTDDGAGGEYILCIGHLHPNNEPRGSLYRIDRRGRVMPVLEKLSRPVDMATGDLDGDGLRDLVIAGFGHYTGRLAWWRGLGGHRFEEKVLLAEPGALCTYVRDLNGDGLPDILTLMAQGDERIVAHYNRGSGRFRMEVLLRFDPVMGSSYMEPVDIDRDGDLDLVYTSGDNADHSFLRKPYHGIRIFENTGGQEYREAFFLPLDGATKAIPLDANGDSATDLAVIAFFPDFEAETLQSLLLLERLPGEKMNFRLRSFDEARVGRWLTLDKGDFNGDGLEDLVAGSFSFSPTPTPPNLQQQWMASRTDVLLLYQQAVSLSEETRLSRD